MTRLTIAALIAFTSIASGELTKDIVYAKHDGRELKVDIATPNDDVKKHPAVICIHGGAWQAGHRRAYHKAMERMSERGYVAATVEYRFTKTAAWPAQMKDVQAAHQFLVDHADDYGIDVERIGVMGDSAGGHLALMLGLHATETKDSPRIRAIANFYGPADMRDIGKMKRIRGLIEPLVGGKLEEKTEILSAVSPVTYIDRTDPPVITFHGTKDRIVSVEQGHCCTMPWRKRKFPIASLSRRCWSRFGRQAK